MKRTLIAAVFVLLTPLSLRAQPTAHNEKTVAQLQAEMAAGTLTSVQLTQFNIDRGDKMQTTAGSFALLGKPAIHDSTVAANLRATGAVLLGKTNLSEWANFRSFFSSSGWSGRGGLTANPYSLD